MFEATSSRSLSLPLVAVVLVAGIGGLMWARPDLAERASEQVDLLLAGSAPGASLFAEEHSDFPYERSPLAVALEQAEPLGRTDADAVLAWADDLARDMGLWMLRQTATSDVAHAERVLWESAKQDAFAVELARQLRERDVYARRNKRLDRVPEQPPTYVNRDELAWIGAHVAWRLDLKVRLARSPVHHYLVWTSPSGGLERLIELTNFRGVDEKGQRITTDEKGVGTVLVGPADLFSSGAGGIHELRGDGIYRDVAPERLDAEVLQQVITWKELTEGVDFSDAAPEARYELALRRGMQGWKAQDVEAMRAAYEEAVAVRTEHPDAVPEVPRENVFGVAAGVKGVSLRPVYKHYDTTSMPDRPVDDFHEVAMWLDLRDGRPSGTDYNMRVVPLTVVSRTLEERLELCRAGRKVLLFEKKSLPEVWIAQCEELEARP